MPIADRIARLEAKMLASAGPVVPVFCVILSGGDESLPYEVEHGGRTWQQLPGESTQELMQRARSEALQTFVPAGKYPVLALTAQRPEPPETIAESRRNAARLPATVPAAPKDSA